MHVSIRIYFQIAKIVLKNLRNQGFYLVNFQVTYQVCVQLHRMMHKTSKLCKNNNLSEKNNFQVNPLTWK